MSFKNIESVFPGWRIVRQIGAGGFGKVYEIERDRFGKIEKAALKVMNIPSDTSIIADMRDDGYENESIRRRLKADLDSFASEYDHMREVKHTNIVSCDDIEYEENKDSLGYTVYLKMELLTPLTESLKNGFDREKTAIALAKDICRALELCERRKIVHRDIKPQNLFVNAHGEYKLGDFGIARKMDHATNATKTGTYKYMAPEVYNNKAYDHSVDIYSLGLVMYWLLNDMRMPFVPLPPAVPTSRDEERAKYRRLSGERIPEPRYGSDGLKKIVLKACEADRTKRYKSAADMLADLEALGKCNENISVAKANGDWDDDITDGVSVSSESGTADGEWSFGHGYGTKQSNRSERTRGNSWNDDDVTFDSKAKRGNGAKARSNPYVNSTPGVASSGKSSGYSKSTRDQSSKSDDKTEAAQNYSRVKSEPKNPESGAFRGWDSKQAGSKGVYILKDVIVPDTSNAKIILSDLAAYLIIIAITVVIALFVPPLFAVTAFFVFGAFLNIKDKIRTKIIVQGRKVTITVPDYNERKKFAVAVDGKWYDYIHGKESSFVCDTEPSKIVFVEIYMKLDKEKNKKVFDRIEKIKIWKKKL